LTIRRTSCCRREPRFEPGPPLRPERRARARRADALAADLCAGAPPLSSRVEAADRALVFAPWGRP
jgi:hypothetical protein